MNGSVRSVRLAIRPAALDVPSLRWAAPTCQVSSERPIPDCPMPGLSRCCGSLTFTRKCSRDGSPATSAATAGGRRQCRAVSARSRCKTTMLTVTVVDGQPLHIQVRGTAPHFIALGTAYFLGTAEVTYTGDPTPGRGLGPRMRFSRWQLAPRIKRRCAVATASRSS